MKLNKMLKKKFLSICFILSFILFSCANVNAQKNSIAAAQAINYVGKTVSVCDRIDEAALDNISKDEPTVLYTGTSFEGRTLALVFSKRALATFSYEPTAKMINHTFCVHGKITMYKGKPAMYIKSASQITHIG